MYTVIRATSATLADLLRARIGAEPALAGFFAPAGNMVVSLATPEEMEQAPEQGVSVWLYRVARDEHLLNVPVVRPAIDRLSRPRLPLQLHYLMTPIVGDEVEVGNRPRLEQEILGKVIQTFHDTPILEAALLREDLVGTDARITVRWETKTIEEITRIWDALESSYQLCVSYQVSVVLVDSDRPIADTAVVDSIVSDVGVARRAEVDA
jgi:hypothetical protein